MVGGVGSAQVASHEGQSCTAVDSARSGRPIRSERCRDERGVVNDVSAGLVSALLTISRLTFMGPKKFDFFSREIETTTPIPFDQAWSRAYKKVGVVVSIAPYAEKYASQGAENGHFPIQKRSLAFEDQ